MADYCKCGLLLLTERERTVAACRVCKTDYERKYAELIKYNRFYERRTWHYAGAAFTVAAAFGYWILK